MHALKEMCESLTGSILRSYDKQMSPRINSNLNVVLCLVLLLSIGCQAIPTQPATIPANVQPAQAAHARKLNTPSYGGGGAVIFVMDQIGSDRLKSISDAIIRTFGENNAPLTVAVPPVSENGSEGDLRYLTAYVDAGIIDISLDGNSIPWLPTGLPFQTVSKWPEYSALTDRLGKSREQIKMLYGEAPAACIAAPAALDQANYSALQGAGYRALCSTAAELHPSIQPASVADAADKEGIYRLPVIGTLFTSETLSDDSLAEAINRLLDSSGVAVIEIRPAAFAGMTPGTTDTAKLKQLSALIKSCKSLGEITTLESWYRLMSSLLTVPNQQRPLPPYNGGPVIIFRLDDVAKGYQEQSAQEIIKLFEQNGLPVDVGVVSNANGTDSFDIPWLKQAYDRGIVGISVHGFDWIFLQLDIRKTAVTHHEDNPCIDWLAAGREAETDNLTYRKVRSKFMIARAQYLRYFGVSPTALTVPTDFFDEDGYRAAEDAGFKVFAAHIMADAHPSSAESVDFFGHPDHKGMYRVPTASDVCIWSDNCSWGDVYNVSQQASIPDYCKYHQAFDEMTTYNDLAFRLCGILEQLGVAALGIHPNAFQDREGKPDRAKLDKLDKIIKWCKSFAAIMTYEQWYRYQLQKK